MRRPATSATRAVLRRLVHVRPVRACKRGDDCGFGVLGVVDVRFEIAADRHGVEIDALAAARTRRSAAAPRAACSGGTADPERSPSAAASRDRRAVLTTAQLARPVRSPPSSSRPSKQNRAGCGPRREDEETNRIVERMQERATAASQGRAGDGTARPREAAGRGETAARVRRGRGSSRARRCPGSPSRGRGRRGRAARATQPGGRRRRRPGRHPQRRGSPAANCSRSSPSSSRSEAEVMRASPVPHSRSPPSSSSGLASAARRRRYSAIASAVDPSNATEPWRSSTARSHSRSTACASWETKRIVPPRPLNSAILPKHLRWNCSSPTANTSSSSRRRPRCARRRRTRDACTCPRNRSARAGR